MEFDPAKVKVVNDPRKGQQPAQPEVKEPTEPIEKEGQKPEPTQKEAPEAPAKEPGVPVKEVDPQAQPAEEPSKEEPSGPDYSALADWGTPEEIANRLKELSENKYLTALEQEGVKKLIDAHAAGKLSEYQRISQTDYDSMAHESLFKEKLRREHPSLSERAIEYQLQQELEKYQVDDEDSPEAEVKKELFRAEAEKLRQQFNKEKEEFQIPEFQLPEAAPQMEVPSLEDRVNQVKGEKPIQQIFETKQVTSQIGEDRFNHEVDPNQIAEMAADIGLLLKPLFDGDKPDYAKVAKAAAYLSDMDGYDARLVQWARGLGQKSLVDEMGNASQPSRPDGGTKIKGKDYSHMDDKSRKLLEAALKKSGKL